MDKVNYQKAQRYDRHIRLCGRPRTLLIDVIKRGSFLDGTRTYTVVDLTNHLYGRHPVIGVYDKLDLETLDAIITEYARKLGYSQISVEFIH